MAELITRLFKSNMKWHWGEEQYEAFEYLKSALTKAPILAHPMFKDVVENSYNLQTDASAS